jgi:hypothetical protein
MYVMTRPELFELGAPKMKGQEPMTYFTKKTFLDKIWFFSELDPLDYLKI